MSEVIKGSGNASPEYVVSQEDREMYEIYKEELPEILRKIEELTNQVRLVSRHDQATATALGDEIKVLEKVKNQYEQVIKKIEAEKIKSK